MNKWLLVFLVLPLVEMAILIEVGARIGSWPTIGLVVGTALLGVALLKRQGFATLLRGQARLAAGELPLREIAEGLLLAVAGALLLTPGFVTDCCGFVLLAPPPRRRLASGLLARFAPAEGGGAGRVFDGTPQRPG